MGKPGSIVCALVLLAGCGWSEGAALREQRASRLLESLRVQPDAVLGFVTDMPKGADLHNHLSGAVSTESFIKWGAEDGACVDANTLVASNPCAAGAVPLNTVSPGSALYTNVVGAWSMEGFQGDVAARHKHFFDSFGKFGAVSGSNRNADMVAEAVTTAATHHQTYVELMMGFGSSRAGALASKYMAASDTWDDAYLQSKRGALIADPVFQSALTDAKANAELYVAQAHSKLGCDAASPPAGCGVGVRFLVQASRTQKREYVFAQFVFAFELAQQAPLVAGLNIVQQEEDPNSLLYYDDEMKALDVLFRANQADTARTRVHIALHAGELIRDVLPATPEGQRHLTFHIRRAVEVGHAERIGHGVDVLAESEGAGAEQLLMELHERDVLVEACLTSNNALLDATGASHPLAAYLSHQVPVSLATDDLGVLRSNISVDYQRAVVLQGVDYAALKQMARASLEHSFASGDSLWMTTGTHFLAVAACAAEEPGNAKPSAACRRFLDGSERASRQWQLEADLISFENTHGKT